MIFSWSAAVRGSRFSLMEQAHHAPVAGEIGSFGVLCSGSSHVSFSTASTVFASIEDAS
jgi:hypothetical protein